ncbi:MAG: tetratricopeptide repeat protein [Alphaproteobacteria bacterium]|nr:tetratricopeptide repeat protein [Alphaproteobacteria bacterium]
MTPMSIEDIFRQALVHHQAGRLPEAERDYRRVLAEAPGHPDANHNLGMIALQVGRPALGLDYFRAAMAAVPGAAVYASSYAEALLASGDAVAALGVLDRPPLLGRDDEEARELRGRVLRGVGGPSPEERRSAVDCYNAGVGLHGQGRLEEAAEQYRRAVSLNPAFAEAHNNLGIALAASGRFGEAEDSYRTAVALKPGYADALFNLGVFYGDRGRFKDAVVCYDQAIAHAPSFAEAHNNRGTVLNELGRFREAAESHERALALRPDFAGAHYNLGNAIRDMGDTERAIASYERSLEIDPTLSEAHNALGNAVKTLGRIDAAMDHFRRAIALNPGGVLTNTNLLVATLYHPSMTEEERFALHREFEDRHARPLYPDDPVFPNPPDPSRRLRVGYVSANIHQHPVARNLLPVIEAHDRERFEIHFYADVPVPDGMTARFQALADGWHPTLGDDDRGVAERVRADGIDILISLAGHFDNNRPLVCAHRPAPVQISFHDPVTSGLEVVDALITDRVMTPRRGLERFTERPMRLPSFYLHAPMTEAPDPAPPPMAVNGYPTFGSFNNPAKLSDETLRLWARVMEAVPEARLRLKYRNWFGSDGLARRVMAFMGERDIIPERVELLSRSDDVASHLALYGGVDIALDPFPFNGSTTTFESFWMGVPVVALLGNAMVSRWTASMLTAVGLTGWIAATPDDYVAICRRMSAAPEDLGRLRQDLRRRVAASSLCDARRKTRQIERIYRAMWRGWCASGRQERHDRR